MRTQVIIETADDFIECLGLDGAKDVPVFPSSTLLRIDTRDDGYEELTLSASGFILGGGVTTRALLKAVLKKLSPKIIVQVED